MISVILITNQEDIKQTLQEQLVLLRSSDCFICSDYASAPDVLYDKRPEIVILHELEDRDKTINLIKYLKEKRIFVNTNIILLVNKYDRDFILNAYDEGIDDYFTISSDPSEMLIRTINCIKKSDNFKEVNNLRYYLSSYGIISPQSGFFSAKFLHEIFEMELVNRKFKNACLLIISPDEEGKKHFSDVKMNFAIKNSIRKCDFVAESAGSKYYLLLDTDISGAVCVFDKIRSLLPENLTVKGGISAVESRKFSDIEKKAMCALNNALLNAQDYSVYAEEQPVADDWLHCGDNEEKSFKFFKSVYCKKLEKVIAPVFYRLQKTYEDKLYNTKIEQFTDEKQCVFKLSNRNNESVLKIVYPGFSKIVVYIFHSGLDSPENREITLPLTKITSKDISKIVEDFIEEFESVLK